MNKPVRTARIFAVIMSVLLVVSICPTIAFAWGDNGGGRPSYSIEEINDGALGDTVVFNSISDGVLGDEKNFVAAIRSGDKEAKYWNANTISAVDGQRYTIRLYVHNNNPAGNSALSEDTKVFFGIPNTSATEHRISGYIEASNASPSRYWDNVDFISDGTPFHIEYILGSGLFQNNGIGANGGIQLSDNVITTTGVLIGYEALDGRIPGGFAYDGLVTIEVKVVYDYEFDANIRVRPAGTEKWRESIDAKVGDQVEFAIKYENTSELPQHNVVVKCAIPEGMEYVEESTYLYNSNHPNGIRFTDETITKTGVNIGNYAANGYAYITFSAKLTDKIPAADSSTLVNWAQVRVGSSSQERCAPVFIQRTIPIPWVIIICLLLTLLELAVVIFLWRILRKRKL